MTHLIFASCLTFSRHLIFASLKILRFLLNREIREINVSPKFHVIRYVIKGVNARPASRAEKGIRATHNQLFAF